MTEMSDETKDPREAVLTKDGVPFETLHGKTITSLARALLAEKDMEIERLREHLDRWLESAESGWMEVHRLRARITELEAQIERLLAENERLTHSERQWKESSKSGWREAHRLMQVREKVIERRTKGLLERLKDVEAQRDAYADTANWQVDYTGIPRDIMESLRILRLNHLTVRYVGPTPFDIPDGVQPSPSRVTPSMIQDASLEVFRSHGKGVAVYRPDQAAALAAALNRQLHPSDSPEAEEPESEGENDGE